MMGLVSSLVLVILAFWLVLSIAKATILGGIYLYSKLGALFLVSLLLTLLVLAYISFRFGLHRRLARALETYPAPSLAERVLGILVLLSVPAIFLAAAAYCGLWVFNPELSSPLRMTGVAGMIGAIALFLHSARALVRGA